METTQLALAFINRFRKVKRPGSTELVSIKFNFTPWEHSLLKYFKSQTFQNSQDIRTKTIEGNGIKSYSQHYLVAISYISKIFGAYLYMTEKLEDGFIEPHHRILVIGQKDDVTIVHYLAEYLIYNELGIIHQLRKTRKKDIHPNTWAKQLRVTFYIDIIKYLQKYIGFREKFIKPDVLEKRNSYVLQFIINNLKFEYNEKNIPNPLLTGYDGTILDKFKIMDGVWKNKHLIWPRIISK